eukprot:TRINITY_DN39207_c0_g1_i1.p1 TRINITY_DN39207_c0_g1~~TRINITY_DN39207_c0_g1_i1.p1  ORF type:complete len:381 (+),score=40.06 TRINITY_DN39207_c0_g1_i1:152-1144(+)
MSALTPSVRRVCQTALGAMADATRLCLEIRSDVSSDMVAKKKTGDILSAAEYVVQAKLTKALINADPSLKIPIVAEECISSVPDDIRQKFLIHATRLARFSDANEIRDLIEESSHDFSPGTRSGLWWAMDAIDGTEAFTKGGQFSIALTLLDGPNPIFSALSCPSWESRNGGTGIVCHAFAGSESNIPVNSPAEPRAAVRIAISPEDKRAEGLLAFVHENFSGHSWARHVLVQRVPSQVKYIMAATREANAFIKCTEYEAEDVWDHVAGALILRGAGGRVSSTHGDDIRFSTESAKIPCHGIIATSAEDSALHEELVELTKKYLSHSHAN